MVSKCMGKIGKVVGICHGAATVIGEFSLMRNQSLLIREDKTKHRTISQETDPCYHCILSVNRSSNLMITILR